MIVCPNCNHQNPDGAVQCESCYTPLPSMTTCSNCGAQVQTNAAFCGQCGLNLQKPNNPDTGEDDSGKAALVPPTVVSGVSSTSMPPTISPDLENSAGNGPPIPVIPVPDPSPVSPISQNVATPPATPTPPPKPAPAPIPTPPPKPAPAPIPGVASTQLQQQKARLLHVQSNNEIELPEHLNVIHIGKPNDRVPPDIDVSGFSHSEIVSRIHADIRVEGDGYYIEDVGSSNGTYINNFPLPRGNRHRLRTGDRISLGKGDLMTFLFQIS